MVRIGDEGGGRGKGGRGGEGGREGEGEREGGNGMRIKVRCKELQVHSTGQRKRFQISTFNLHTVHIHNIVTTT